MSQRSGRWRLQPSASRRTPPEIVRTGVGLLVTQCVFCDFGRADGAALGGWGYLVAWGALRAVGATGAARPAGLAIGAAFGVLIAVEIVRLERSD